MTKKQKLELTWVGKDKRPKLEPRILIEDPSKSYHAKEKRSEGDLFDNMLIHGDNLLALKALEQDYAGKVKCIYIDPPFNTGQAFENYDDGIEHSLWLSLMRERLLSLRSLLSTDGTIFIHIDDNELGYLIVAADEVFGRSNRKFIVTFKQGAATGHKAINPGCVTTTNFLLVYAKNSDSWRPNRVSVFTPRDARYSKFIINRMEDFRAWKFTGLIDAFADSLGLELKEARKVVRAEPNRLDKFVLDNASSVTRLARPDYAAVGKEIKDAIDRSKLNLDQIIRVERSGFPDLYIKNGERILFYEDKVKLLDGKRVTVAPLTTLWDDLLSNNIHNEGGVSFPKGKKPEYLIRRCLQLATDEGDIVLDSFSGSGTTGAVAHKMRRRWIMVELGNHCETHARPRLKRVVKGQDSSGVTDVENWHGGGGFRYFELAPSLLEQDKYGNWVISKEYKPEMLAEAMCKHMGFTYAPSEDPEEYWRHGHSTETDFIYVTTQNLTHAALAKIADDVGPDRSLLVCCSAFNADADAFENLTVTKIPQSILRKCEWGRDDYSLNVENLPMAAEEHGEDGAELPLFAGRDAGEGAGK